MRLVGGKQESRGIQQDQWKFYSNEARGTDNKRNILNAQRHGMKWKSDRKESELSEEINLKKWKLYMCERVSK